MEKKVEYLIAHRKGLFMIMCYVLHWFFLIYFAMMHIREMTCICIVGIIFYTVLIVIKKWISEQKVMLSYFEMLLFGGLTTVMLGRQSGFYLYILGLLAVTFFLVNEKSAIRFICQAIGTVILIALILCDSAIQSVWVDLKIRSVIYTNILFLLNMIFTILLVTSVSFLFVRETQNVNQEIVSKNQELDYKASHDQLTGLLNRHIMSQYIEEIGNLNRRELMVAMMDVDDFKKLNDTYGHAAGDVALLKIAEFAKKYLKDFKVARWGGEEFLAVSDNIPKSVAMVEIADFHNQIGRYVTEYEDKKFSVHLTIGAANGNDTTQIEQLVKKADNLLYVGKNSTKNCIVTMANVKQYAEHVKK